MGRARGSLLSDILKTAFIFLFAVILLSAVAFFVLRVVVRGNEIEVPNVIGRSFVDASRILSEHGLDTVKIEGEKYSATLPKSHVLEQDPIPNKKVKPGRVIKVFLSRGTEQGRVPRLIGRPVSEVETMLTSRGLEIGSVVKVHSDDFPQEGLIIAHTPPPDVTAQWGSKVSLLVSLGPHSTILTMPDLNGMEQQKALETLSEIGLKQGNITREASPEGQKAGIVLRHFPPSNDRVKRGTAVEIIVSSGEVSEGTLRTVVLPYVIPPRPRTSEEPENPEERQEEDLSPRSVLLNLSHSGAKQPIVVPKSGRPGTRISHFWRVKGVAVLKIYVDDLLTETMISKPPSTEFVRQ
ncbi:PASTA domain-containing protein [Candidatus Poribacteria bacterium]